MSDVEGDAVVSNPKKKLKTGTLCVETQTQVQEKKAAESQTEDIFPGDFNAKVGTDSDLSGGVIGPFGIGSCNANGKYLLQDTRSEVMPPPDLAFADANHVAIADAIKDQPLYKDEETILNGSISPKRKERSEKEQLPDSQPETATPLLDNSKQKTEIAAANPDIDNAPSVEKNVQKDSIKETS